MLQRLLIAYGHLVFRYLDYLAPLLLFAGIGLTTPRPFLNSVSSDVWLDALGVAIALCGQTLRVAVIGLAYIQRGGKNKEIAADRLVSEGFFAHSRNPRGLSSRPLTTS